jgi:hypothetical protein
VSDEIMITFSIVFSGQPPPTMMNLFFTVQMNFVQPSI